LQISFFIYAGQIFTANRLLGYLWREFNLVSLDSLAFSARLVGAAHLMLDKGNKLFPVATLAASNKLT